jgi:hypothetical protein
MLLIIRLPMHGSPKSMRQAPMDSWLGQQVESLSGRERLHISIGEDSMSGDHRVWIVREHLVGYVSGRSLRLIRDPHSLTHLAQRIVEQLNRGDSIWKKWSVQREMLLKSALGTWIPLPDLREFLNHLPGPNLTMTDVTQRLKALEEENSTYPNEELRAGCRALYEKEKAEGTELPAIAGLLRDYVEQEEERLRAEHKQRWAQLREEERIAREQRLLSGADCGWTQLQNSPLWHCRTNGRMYRLSPTKEKMWHLHRVKSVADEEPGPRLGTYRGKREATKAVAEMAFQPEPRWLAP